MKTENDPDHSDTATPAVNHPTSGATGSGSDRNEAIGKVWATTVGLLALCIPLVILTKMTFLPLVVLAGATAVTAFLWVGGRDDRRDDIAAENEALREQIRKLEERLENVEVINRFEERLAAKEAEQRLAREGDVRAMGPAAGNAGPSTTGEGGAISEPGPRTESE